MDWIVFPLLEGTKLGTVRAPGGLIKGIDGGSPQREH